MASGYPAQTPAVRMVRSHLRLKRTAVVARSIEEYLLLLREERQWKRALTRYGPCELRRCIEEEEELLQGGPIPTAALASVRGKSPRLYTKCVPRTPLPKGSASLPPEARVRPAHPHRRRRAVAPAAASGHPRAASAPPTRRRVVINWTAQIHAFPAERRTRRWLRRTGLDVGVIPPPEQCL